MVKFINNLVAFSGAHMRQNLVLVVKTLPLGTSGVWVDTVTETDFSRSKKSIFSTIRHLVDLGPIDAYSGLMYE